MLQWGIICNSNYKCNYGSNNGPKSLNQSKYPNILPKKHELQKIKLIFFI